MWPLRLTGEDLQAQLLRYGGGDEDVVSELLIRSYFSSSCFAASSWFSCGVGFLTRSGISLGLGHPAALGKLWHAASSGIAPSSSQIVFQLSDLRFVSNILHLDL